MSWNQSVCFLKNKLAWSGCGLVWQAWSVWVCKVLVGLVWVWQVWSGRFGFVRFWWVRLGHDLAGQVRYGKASYAEVR